jgi:putative flippase GtrA
MRTNRYVRFVVVGTAAAATHFLVAVGFVSLSQWPPQFANIAGYIVALVASYLGQSLWTFAQPTVSVMHFAKFSVTSLSGFILNATAYAALLHWTRLDYRVALILVLLLVAFLTFLGLSKWVFAVTKRQGTS